MKNICFLALFLFAVPVVMFSQEIPTCDQSPEAASLGVVENVPMDYYHGQINPSISLFDVNIRNYEMLVSLSYNSGGFTPNIISGCVGQNWTLNVGGVITRAVKKLPDEKRDYGLYYTYEQFLAEKDYSGMRFKDIDCEPDEFCYNVNGFSGRFYLNKDRKFVAISAPGVKIDYEFNKTFSVSGNGRGTEATFSKFIITSVDGTVYEFGGNENLIETSLVGDQTTSVATAWYLARIKRSDPYQEIIFEYTPKMKDYTYVYSETDKHIGNTLPCGGYRNNVTGICLHHIYLKKIITPTSTVDFYMSNIDYNNYSLSKAYNPQWQKIDSILLKNNSTNRLINSVKFAYYESAGSLRLFLRMVKKNNEPSYSFDYYDYDKENKIPFSTKDIDYWGYYNNFSKMAFRSEGENNLLVDQFFSYQDLMTGVVFYVNRDPNPDAATIGMLKNIYYPLGGHIRFYYEPNTFSSVVTPVVDSDYCRFLVFPVQQRLSKWKLKIITDLGPNIPSEDKFKTDMVAFAFVSILPHSSMPGKRFKIKLSPTAVPGGYGRRYFLEIANKGETDSKKIYPLEGMYQIQIDYREVEPAEEIYASGVRIKRIEKKDNDKIFVKEFSYDVDPGNHVSTGILGSAPSFTYTGHMFFSFYYTTQWLISSSTRTPLGLANGYPLGYSKVTEIDKDADNNILGSTVYRFTNFDLCPDEPVYVYSGTNKVKGEPGVRSSTNYKRGKIYSKNVYSSEGKLLRADEFTYSDVVNGENMKGITYLNQSDFSYCREDDRVFYAKARFYHLNKSYLITKHINKNFDADKDSPIITTTTNNYNGLNLIKSSEIENSDGSKKKIEYKYVSDSLNIYVDCTRLNAMLEKKTYKDNTLQLKENWEYGGNTLCFYQSTSGVGGIVSNVVYSDFDNLFNPIYIIQNQSAKTVLLWSYGGSYLVAKIENATINEVIDKLGDDFVRVILPFQAEMSTNCLSKINSLRSTLPNALVTTYTHIPLVGVTSVTDPRGMTYYYDYDKSSMLKREFIINKGVEETLYMYDYNYKNKE